MKHIINKELLKKYIEENKISLDEFIEEIVQKANMPITKTDIKLIINKINNNSLEKTDEKLITALVSVLYDLTEEEIEGELIKEEVEETEAKLVKEEVEETEEIEDELVKEEVEDYVEIKKQNALKSIKQVSKDSNQQKNGSSFLVTLLISIVLFGGYIGYKEFKKKDELNKELKEKLLTIDKQKEEINRLKNKNKKLKRKEKRDKKNFKIMRDEILKLKRFEGKNKKKAKSINMIKKENSNFNKKKDKYNYEIKEINPRIKKSLKSDINELKNRLDNYKNTIKEKEILNEEKQNRFKILELKALEYEERKILENPKFELFKHNKEFYKKEKEDYSIDEETKNIFLKDCLNGYEDRRVDYIRYCVCISDEIVKNKVNYIDALMALRKNLKNNRFIGIFDKNKEEMTYSEIIINKNTKHCYEKNIKLKVKNPLILKY